MAGRGLACLGAAWRGEAGCVSGKSRRQPTEIVSHQWMPSMAATSAVVEPKSTSPGVSLFTVTTTLPPDTRSSTSSPARPAASARRARTRPGGSPSSRSDSKPREHRTPLLANSANQRRPPGSLPPEGDDREGDGRPTTGTGGRSCRSTETNANADSAPEHAACRGVLRSRVKHRAASSRHGTRGWITDRFSAKGRPAVRRDRS